MIELRLSNKQASDLAVELIGYPTEKCAVLFASRASRSDGAVHLVVNDCVIPDSVDYDLRSGAMAQLNPEFVARVSKRASRRNESIIFVHSHLGDSHPEFSGIDDDGELQLAAFLSVRTPHTIHAALVVSRGGWRGRRLGSDEPIRIVSVGERREVLFEPSVTSGTISQVYDRQVKAFGRAGQSVLASLRVAIVGLGGTGSIVAQQLAYLGVRDFTLLDPDVIETTNLNRVVGATASDVGHLKVDIAAAQILAVSPQSTVKKFCGDVTRTQFARELVDVDFIFSCTDSHGSRATVQQVAYQYLIPAIDMGTVVTAEGERVSGIHGRVQALAPGLACLNCTHLIDSEQVRRDMMSDEERRSDPYIVGASEAAPAIISINSTVSSLAVTMFMAITLGIPSAGRHILYSAATPSLRSVRGAQDPHCYICSPNGVLAKGDSQTLLTRDQ